MGVHALDGPVTSLLRTVAAEIVMPHFRTLTADEIAEKEPGDLVTIADRAAEERLAAGLAALLPAARVIGEEAVAADASLLDGIDRGLAWIVDPIDGTGNYAAGHAPFAIMVALVEDGVVQAGWILDPLSGRLCHAALGGGAFVDGERIVARTSGARAPVAAFATLYLPPEVRLQIETRMLGHYADVPIPRCAGEQYPRLVTGENDIALFWRALPWDHAPGALFLTEAGGRIAQLDGAPYSVAISGRGLLAAASPALWDQARTILFD